MCAVTVSRRSALDRPGFPLCTVVWLADCRRARLATPWSLSFNRRGNMSAPFKDRRDAGRALARKLTEYANDPAVVVLALPRGGVPVGYEVAVALRAPLDVFVVRKLGVPGYEEAAFGAIASGGTRVLDPEVVAQLRLPNDMIDAVTRRERLELERREQLYRPDRPFVEVAARTVILVDDGIATGASMYAAAEAIRLEHPERLVIAAPVASPAALRLLSKVADDCVCVIAPEMLHAVGLWYEDFSQTTNEEVRSLLRDAGQGTQPPRAPATSLIS